MFHSSGFTFSILVQGFGCTVSVLDSDLDRDHAAGDLRDRTWRLCGEVTEPHRRAPGTGLRVEGVACGVDGVGG